MSLIALLISIALAQEPLVFDVSGAIGRPGTRGTPGNNGDLHNRAGHIGMDGGTGGPGQNAGRIRLQVSLSEDKKDVLIRGVVKKTDSPEQNVDEKIPVEKFSKLVLKASGGPGGHGGEGGDGGNGADGKNGHGGQRVGFGLDGADGEDGADGGDGGNGGAAADGGDGGDIRVQLAKGAEHLSALIETEARLGSGGVSGFSGRGGRAGVGGRGGYGTCDSGSGLEATKFAQCGSNGRNGRSGQNGKSGRSGQPGKNGKNGSVLVKLPDGSTLHEPYKLTLHQVELQGAVDDGVLEPGEGLTIKSFQLGNKGDQDLPVANYLFAINEASQAQPALGPLQSGKKIPIVLNPPMTANTPPTPGFFQIPLKIKIEGVTVPYEALTMFKTEAPVSLVPLPKAPVRLTTLKRSAPFQLKLQNISGKSYGAQGETARSVKLKFSHPQETEEEAPEIAINRGPYVSLTTPYVQDIEKINAHKTLSIQGQVKVPESWRTGVHHFINLQVEIQNSAAAIEVIPLKLQYATDIKDQFTLETNIGASNFTCNFSGSWWNYDLQAFKLSKEKNTMTLVIHLTLKKKNEVSPPYELEYALLSGDTKQALFNKKHLSDRHILEIMKKMKLRAGGSSWWAIDECESGDEEVTDEAG